MAIMRSFAIVCVCCAASLAQAQKPLPSPAASQAAKPAPPAQPAPLPPSAPSPAPSVAVTPPPPPPPSAEALKAANELVTILTQGSLNQDPAKTWPAVAARLTNPKLDEDTMAALRADYERIQTDRLGAIQKEADAIYASHFTVVELRDLIAFYKTPTGQKALTEMPKVSVEYRRVVQPEMQELQAEIFVDFRKVLRDHGFVK